MKSISGCALDYLHENTASPSKSRRSTFRLPCAWQSLLFLHPICICLADLPDSCIFQPWILCSLRAWLRSNCREIGPRYPNLDSTNRSGIVHFAICQRFPKHACRLRAQTHYMASYRYFIQSTVNHYPYCTSPHFINDTWWKCSYQVALLKCCYQAALLTPK